MSDGQLPPRITVYAVLLDDSRGDDALKMVTRSKEDVDDFFEENGISDRARQDYWTVEEWEV
jgi:hypothetical protein